MKSMKKALSVFMAVLMIFSAMSAGFIFSASAAECNHNIGVEGSTMHEYAREDAICNKEGRVYYDCTVCTYTTSVVLPIDPNNHAVGGWSVVEGKEPTCSEEGEKIRYCLNPDCDYSETGTVPATGKHTYIDAAVLDFWWTADGITAGGEYEGWTIVSVPTCIKEGLAKTVCTYCGGAEITHELAIHSASFRIVDGETKEPTCINKGSCVVYCGVCNANYTLSIPVNEDNHSWKYKVTTEPTCTEKGEETAYCTYHRDLTDTPTREIPAKGHSFTQFKYNNDATCSKDGTETAKCDNCDEEKTVTVEGSKTYCLTSWVFTSGNCTAGGTAKLVCAFPGCQTAHNETKYFAPSAHPNAVTTTIPATCAKDGAIVSTCPDCGAVSSEAIEKTGHDTKTVNKTSASCITKQNRVDLKICQVCGDIETVETPYTHNFVTVSPAVDPTCTKKGSTAHLKCIDCGYEEASISLPALGHKDTNNDGCCNVCYVYFVENSEGEVVDCKCLCHNPDGLAKLFFKIYNFFCKLFGTSQSCECGKLHYEKPGLN